MAAKVLIFGYDKFKYLEAQSNLRNFHLKCAVKNFKNSENFYIEKKS